MVVSVKFEADISQYGAEIDGAIQAIKDWESQTGVSALNATGEVRGRAAGCRGSR